MSTLSPRLEPVSRRHARLCALLLDPAPAPSLPALLGLLLLALGLGFSSTGPAATVHASDCTGTQTGMVPLSDLGMGGYKGHVGGLYGGGANQPPAAHAAVAMDRSAEIVPRGADGTPDPAGAVVLLSVGMSNTTQEFSTFVRLAAGDTSLHPSLRIIDGAQGGQTAADIRDPQANFWRVVDQRLTAAGSTPAQVQAVWLKSANRQPGGDGNPDSLPAARKLSEDIEGVVAVLRERFPNLGIVYLSSRIYAGYASSTLNPEPYAYESGLAVRWLIERQLAGEGELDPATGAPLLLWGPYLWADGLNPRSDGLTWACSDFNDDGTHPANPGRDKVAAMLMDFFSRDDSSRPWFLADPDATPAPSATPDPNFTPPSSATPAPRPTQGGGTASPRGLRSYRVIERPSDDRIWVSVEDAVAQRRLDGIPAGREVWLCAPVNAQEGSEWGFEFEPSSVAVLPEPPAGATRATIRGLAADPAAASGQQCIRIGGVEQAVDGPPPGAGLPTASPGPGEPTDPAPTEPPTRGPRSTDEPTPTPAGPIGPGTPARDARRLFLPALLRDADIGASATAAPWQTAAPDWTPTPPGQTALPGRTATPTPDPTSHPTSTLPAATPPREPLGLGRVTRLPEACRNFSSRIPGSTCMELEIICPSAAAIRLRIAITEPPAGVASRGTIVFGTGGGGQGFYEGFGEFAVQALVDLNAAGYRIVQRSWGSAWEAGEAGMLASSCRYATLISWLEAEAHDADTAFCATGNSGGSAEIGYALARWEQAPILDYALLTGGPPMSRMDLACGGEYNAAWMAECKALEPEASNCDGWSCLYSEGNRGTIDSAYAGRPCQDRNLPPLLADSIMAPEAELHYPQTVVGFIIGDRDCGNSPSQGLLYYRAITSETTFFVAANTPHAVPSSREGAAAVRDGMMQGCRVDGGR